MTGKPSRVCSAATGQDRWWAADTRSACTISAQQSRRRAAELDIVSSSGDLPAAQRFACDKVPVNANELHQLQFPTFGWPLRTKQFSSQPTCYGNLGGTQYRPYLATQDTMGHHHQRVRHFILQCDDVAV